jgi:hypothetical protein
MGKLSVSTDINLFCKPADIYELYGQEFDGVEVIGWRWSEFFLRKAKEANVPLWRLHGRIGNGLGRFHSRARIDLLNQLLLPTRHILQLANKYQIEKILLHVNEVLENWEETVSVCKGVEVAVENSDRTGSGLEAAFETAERLREAGVNSKVVGDVGHFGLEMGGKSAQEEVMQLFLQNMIVYRKKFDIETGAHLPINKESDGGAVDIDQISDETLTRFISSFDDLVIENQVNPFLAVTKAYSDAFRLNSRRRWNRIKTCRVSYLGRRRLKVVPESLRELTETGMR